MWLDEIESQSRDGFGFILKNKANEVGYESIMTPGSLKAYYEALDEYGTMDWKDIVNPQSTTRRKASRFTHFDEFWSASNIMGRMAMVDKLRHTDAARDIYFNEAGETYPIGSAVSTRT